MSEITRILSAIEAGNAQASEQLLPLVYDELRKLAKVRMAQESPGHTLQPTALVHEAWLRLVDAEGAGRWDGRGHFFAAAAEAMRRILVDAARAKRTQRRGGNHQQRDLLDGDAVQLPIGDDLLDLNDALDRLVESDRNAAEVVKLRVFGGMTVDEAAAVLNISPRTVKRDWAWARAWLARELRGAGTAG